MRKLIIEKNDLYSMLIRTIDQYSSEWQGNIPFSNVFSEFNVKYTEFFAKFGLYIYDRRVFTSQKKEIRSELIDLTYSISSKVRSYALINNEDLLADIVKFTHTTLLLARDNDLIAHSTLILNKATENIANLGPFLIDSTLLNSFESKINAFENQVNDVDEQKISSKKLTAQINLMAKEIDYFIKTKLDTSMMMFYTTNPEFYRGYKGNRKIQHQPTTRMAIMGKIVDAESKLPLEGVDILVIERKVKRKSTAKGQFWIKNIPNDTYNIQFSKDGFKIQTIRVYVMTQTTAKPVVELEKN